MPGWLVSIIGAGSSCFHNWKAILTVKTPSFLDVTANYMSQSFFFKCFSRFHELCEIYIHWQFGLFC